MKHTALRALITPLTPSLYTVGAPQPLSTTINIMSCLHVINQNCIS